MNKRVAIFIPSLHGGGAEKAMVNVANGIVRKGYSVDLILTKAEGEYLNDINKDVNIINLNKPRVLYSILPLIKYLRNIQPHSILSAMNYVNLICIFSVWMSGVKSRIIVSERTTLSKVKKFNKNYKRKIINLLVKKMYTFTDKIICVSNGVAEDLHINYKIPNEKLCVIYNPVVNKKLIELSEENFNHNWFQSGQVPVILSVGRLIEDKDFDTLIYAYSEVIKSYNCKLLILGEGDKRKHLEELILKLGLQDMVSLPGFVNNPYVYMKNAAVFVLSSRREGLPNVLIEAMACGTPVVSTNCVSGPREILEDGKYGTLVNVGDVMALADAINNVLNTNMKVNYSALSKFTEDNVINEYIKILF